jgi:plastocyanin
MMSCLSGRKSFALLLAGLWFAAALTAAAGDEKPAAGGSVKGSVRFTGEVPPPKAVTVADGSTIWHSDLVVDKITQGLRSVFVTLEDGPARPPAADAKPAVMDQRDWVFVPRVLAVRHGQAVRFENSDSVNHNVQALSVVEKNQFNATAAPGQPVVHTFEPHKTPVVIGCGLHPWMRAWVYVVPHPWFAVTDDQGRFELRDVPPGRYTALFVHPDSNLRERRAVRIEPGQSVTLDVTWRTLPKP